MKQKIKKMLLILMVGIGIMGAVSVQAQGDPEKVWVKIGEFAPSTPYRGVTVATGSTHETCRRLVEIENQVKWSNSVFSYKYLNRFQLGPGGSRWTKWDKYGWLSCDVQSIDSRNPSYYLESAVSTYVTCDEGNLFLDSQGGCYEQVETCPEGTVKGEGNVCVVPCTGIGEDGTASPKGCVPVNGPECDEKRSLFSDKNKGFVSCNNGKPDVCAYNDPTVIDSEAQKFARECSFVHEQTHIDTKDEYRGYCRDSEDKPDPNGTLGAKRPALYDGEVDAHYASATCLSEKRKECTTPECFNEMIDLIDDANNKALQNILKSINWKP